MARIKLGHGEYLVDVLPSTSNLMRPFYSSLSLMNPDIKPSVWYGNNQEED